MLKQFISKQNILQHKEVFKIKLSTEQYITLVEVLILAVSNLNNDNGYQRDRLELYRSKIEELQTENKKLQGRLNAIYHNKDSSTSF